MAKAIAARMDGDDYQARWFWIKACELLEPFKSVERVAFEDPSLKSMDDVVVYYSSGASDPFGVTRVADFYQVKFHVLQSGAITADALADPAFINAEAVSFLQRAYNAYSSLPCPRGHRFFLYTPWDVHPDDALAELVHNRDGRIDWDKLAKGGPRSKTGLVREAWKAHLNLSNDDDLKDFLAHLYLSRGHSLLDLGIRLNERLSSVGLKTAEPTCTNCYDSLAHDLLKRNITFLDRATLETTMKARGLWDGGPRLPLDRIPLGIRSRMRFAVNLEDKVKRICCVSECFNDRSIIDPLNWHQIVLPSIVEFIRDNTESGKKYVMYLEAHTSIAFATGYCLPSKAGVDVALVQKSFAGGQFEWNMPGQFPMDEEWVWEQEHIASGGAAIALVLAITHDILPEVKAYIKGHLPEIGHVLTLRPLSGSSSTGIRDAGHAAAMAQSVLQRLRKDNFGFCPYSVIHLFSAAPNGFMFFLGRFVSSIPFWTLYEYDFERQKDGTYTPSLHFPAPIPRTRSETAIDIALDRGT